MLMVVLVVLVVKPLILYLHYRQMLVLLIRIQIRILLKLLWRVLAAVHQVFKKCLVLICELLIIIAL